MVYHTQFYHSNNALYFLQTPEKLSNFKSIILAKTNDVKEVDKIKIVNYSIWLFYVYNNIIKIYQFLSME